MTNLFFTIIGNFITCSYTKNFTVFDLLRRPLVFGGVKQNDMFLIKIPKGLPWEETVLSIENHFTSKLKDLAIKKGVKEADKNSNVIIIESSALESLLYFDKKVEFYSCSLIYSPWYRFVSEPFQIGLVDNFKTHIMETILYFLRSKGVICETGKGNSNGSSVVLKNQYLGISEIYIEEKTSLEKIVLVGESGTSEINFSNKSLVLCEDHDLLLFNALENVDEGSLINIKLIKSKHRIELIYDK